MDGSSPTHARAARGRGSTDPGRAGATPPDPAVAAGLDALLGELELHLLVGDPTAIAARAATVLASARAAGHVVQAGRARLVMADAACRTDDVRGAVEVARLVLRGARDDGTEAALVVAARAEAVLAWSLHRMGLLGESLTHAVESVRLLPATAPAHLRVEHGMVRALLTSIQTPGGAYVREFDTVVAGAQELGDPRLLLMALNNYSWVHHTHGRSAEALPLVTRMQELVATCRLPMTSTVRDTIAAVLLDVGDLDGAERVGAGMLGPDVPENDARARPDALLTLAVIRSAQGAVSDALALVREAGRLAVEREIPEMVAMASEREADLLAELGDHEAAFAALRVSHRLSRLLRDTEAESRAAILHALFETERAHQRSLGFEELADRDALTGLWNRRHVDRVLPDLLVHRSPDDGPLSLAIIDVDDFKRINDTRSHQTGDAVLVRLGEVFGEVVPEPGFVARLGGEEFLVVVPGADAASALATCEATRAAVADQSWREITDGIRVTVSVGVTTVVAGTSVSTALAAADAALYDAKHAGRNRVRTHPLPPATTPDAPPVVADTARPA